MKKILIRFLAITVISALIGLFCPLPPVVNAAGLSNLTDTLSTLADSGGGDVKADHAISFATTTGVASTETIVITFPDDFDGSNDGDGALAVGDVDLFEDTSPDQACGGADETEETLVASGAGSSEWNAVFSGTENRVLTLTSGGASAIIAAGSEVCIKIGENATGGSANSQYINPTTTGEKTVSLTVGSVDSGSYVINIVDDDSVAVTATVNPSLTFAITDVSIGFGTLVSTNSRFATETGSGLDTATSGNAMTIATNAPSGYTVTYNGATLTDTAPTPDTTIDAATVTGDADGTPGTEQFAIGFSNGAGDAAVVTEYDQELNNYKFVAGATTPIISETGATATETISAYYLANISGNTEAGSYSTSITYVASGNF